MKGDILIIDEKHRRAARQVFMKISQEIGKHQKYFITVAGESGAGKSETAAALGEILEKEGYPVLIIQQDDFFIYPPRTNAAMRVKNNGEVGPQEVRLELLDDIIDMIRQGQQLITKPLVIFAEDRITEESIDTSPFKVIILEGTYTTMLHHIDCKVFIDRDVEDTRADRLKRNREKQDDFLEKILKTEHDIISKHKKMADFVITREFDAKINQEKDD